MKKTLLIMILGILLFSFISTISASSSIYNNRYLGDPNEPSTSYYSYTGKSASSSSYSSSTQNRRITMFEGPYTEHYVYKKQNGIQILAPAYSSSGNFNNGGGYSPSYYSYGYSYGSSYGWYGGYSGGYYGGYGYYW